MPEAPRHPIDRARPMLRPYCGRSSAVVAKIRWSSHVPGDAEVARGEALAPVARLLEHALAGRVAGHDRGLHAVKRCGREGEAGRGADGLGHQSSPLMIDIYPVPEVAVLERPAEDAAERDAPDDGPLVLARRR